MDDQNTGWMDGWMEREGNLTRSNCSNGTITDSQINVVEL